MIARAAATLLVCGLALSFAGAARTDARLVLDAAPATNGMLHASLGYAGPSPTSRATDRPSPSSSPANDDNANPFGSGAGVVVLVVIGGAFLWLRSRALRR